jgi:hypothetical protein
VLCNKLCLRYSGYPGFDRPGVVFLFTEFPLHQQISCLFYFPYLRYFIAHEHTLGNLEVIIYFQEQIEIFKNDVSHSPMKHPLLLNLLEGRLTKR